MKPLYVLWFGLGSLVYSYLPTSYSIFKRYKKLNYFAVKDELGYEVKDRSWFEGLSLDAGAR
jgi:hypothetical protein